MGVFAGALIKLIKWPLCAGSCVCVCGGGVRCSVCVCTVFPVFGGVFRTRFECAPPFWGLFCVGIAVEHFPPLTLFAPFVYIFPVKHFELQSAS